MADDSILKRKSRKWIIYFFIQLPLAILALHGFRITDLFPQKPEPPSIFELPSDGVFTLYGSLEGNEVGTITIDNTASGLQCTIAGNEYTEFSKIAGRMCTFNEMRYDSLVFTFAKIKEEDYLVYDTGKSLIVITNIYPSNYQYISLSEKNEISYNYYMLSEITYKEYRHIENALSFSIQDICLFGAYENLYSAVFYTKK